MARLRRTSPFALVGASWLVFIGLVVIVGPLVYRTSYTTIDLTNTFGPRSLSNPLGTDDNGRDMLARLLHGGRVSLLVGLVAAGIAMLVGTLIGGIAGQRGGAVDSVLMRITDTFMSVPTFFLLLTLLALFGSSIPVLVCGIGFTSWESVARVVRGEMLRYKEMEFVLASRAVGLGELRLLLRHLLPQAVPSIIVAAVLATAYAILAEAGLSYLGLGVQPPVPSWGNLTSDGQRYLFVSPSLAIYPGLLITATVLALHVLGDGLRDALDPQLIGTRSDRRSRRTSDSDVEAAPVPLK